MMSRTIMVPIAAVPVAMMGSVTVVFVVSVGIVAVVPMVPITLRILMTTVVIP